MPIFEFRCANCRSVFDYFVEGNVDVDCINCSSEKVMRLNYSFFYPNKTFCPHEKEVDVGAVKSDLGKIMLDKSLSCAGCGVDGELGSCGTGGGCGSGSGSGCGSCGSSCSRV